MKTHTKETLRDVGRRRLVNMVLELQVDLNAEIERRKENEKGRLSLASELAAIHQVLLLALDGKDIWDADKHDTLEMAVQARNVIRDSRSWETPF